MKRTKIKSMSKMTGFEWALEEERYKREVLYYNLYRQLKCDEQPPLLKDECEQYRKLYEKHQRKVAELN